MTTIKNVTEKKVKAQKLNQISQCQQNRQLQQRRIKKEKEKKKVQKNLQNKSKCKKNKCFSCFTAVRVLSLAGSQSILSPQDALQHCADLWTCCGAAQILIWSYSSVFLPPMSTVIRISVFSFVGALNGLLYIPQTQSLPSWLCGFNLQLVQLVGKFWVFFLSHTTSGF